MHQLIILNDFLSSDELKHTYLNKQQFTLCTDLKL